MKYACLIYLPSKERDALAQRGRAALGQQFPVDDDALRGSPRLLAVHALDIAGIGAVSRNRSSRSSTAPGYDDRTRSQLEAIILIEADGLHDALHLAARSPLARRGSIEIRPVKGEEDQHGRGRARHAEKTSSLLSKPGRARRLYSTALPAIRGEL